jgi:hypothetical protein
MPCSSRARTRTIFELRLTPKSTGGFVDHYDYGWLTRDFWEHSVVQLKGVQSHEIEA